MFKVIEPIGLTITFKMKEITGAFRTILLILSGPRFLKREKRVIKRKGYVM